MFELKAGDKVVKLKWGTYAMKLFCERLQMDINCFFDLLGEFANGSSKRAEIFKIVEGFIHAGFEYANGAKMSDMEVCELIDECGGMLKLEKGQIIDYVNYVIENTIHGVTPLPGDKDEKKKLKRTWDDILVTAVECGLTIEKFWQITWRDFSIYLLGHQRKEIAEWERTREVAYMVYCMGQWS